MAAEDAGRRAGRVEQDRVDRRRRRPVHDVGGDDLRPSRPVRARFSRKSRQTTFRDVDRGHVPAGGGELHGLAARRGAEVEHGPALARARAAAPASRRKCPAPTICPRHSRPGRRRRCRARGGDGRACRLTPSRSAGGSPSSDRSAAAPRSAARRPRRPPRPRPRASAPPPASGRVGTSGSVHFSRITVLNTPWTSLRGPPSTSGRTVEMAAWCGVPSASAWTSAMRSAKRALASSGRRFLVARSISASRSGRRRSASAAMAWAKARSSARVEVARGARRAPIRAAGPCAAPRRAGAARRGATPCPADRVSRSVRSSCLSRLAAEMRAATTHANSETPWPSARRM